MGRPRRLRTSELRRELVEGARRQFTRQIGGVPLSALIVLPAVRVLEKVGRVLDTVAVSELHKRQSPTA